MSLTQLQSNVKSAQEVNDLIKDLKQKLKQFEKIDYNTLSSADKIKLNNSMAYSYATIYFAYCKIKDDQMNLRNAAKELERIRSAMSKVKKAE